MLAMAAAQLGYRTVVLDPASSCPAAQVANAQIVGSYDDEQALDQLGAVADVVTYEFENVPEQAARHLAGQGRLFPGPDALAVSQDRLIEKDFLSSIGISTAAYRQVDSQAEIEPAVSALGGSAILKTRRLGYDGKGQARVQLNSPNDAFQELGSVPLIAEAVVDFDCEISVIVARSISGEVRCFEPAVNVHRNGILTESRAPSGQPGAVVVAAKVAGTKLAEALGYVGVLGLELFVMADGQIVANEFAPRVHNSGHWTEHASVTSQFQQHIRAITGQPLGDATSSPCHMINLIGDEVATVPALLADGGWQVHLYGKAQVRPGRKMGHATRLN